MRGEPSGAASVAVLALTALSWATHAAAQAPAPPEQAIPWAFWGDARKTGLAGAAVAVVEDATAVQTNPAGIGAVPLRTLSISLTPISYSWPHKSAGLDSMVGGLPDLSIAIHPAKYLALGARLGSLSERRRLAYDSEVARQDAANSLHTAATRDTALSVAIPTPHLSLGGWVGATNLKLGMRGGSPGLGHALSWGVGALARFGRRAIGSYATELPRRGVQLGAVYRAESNWVPSGPLGARTPPVLSIGASGHIMMGLNQKLLVSTQLDRISGPGPEAGIEFAGAVEFSSFGSEEFGPNGGWQIRAGVRGPSRPGAVVAIRGNIIVPAAWSPESALKGAAYAVGTSFIPAKKKTFLGGRMRFDAAFVWDQAQATGSLGVVYSFPRSHRRNVLGT